jgi:hypothetical protein
MVENFTLPAFVVAKRSTRLALMKSIRKLSVHPLAEFRKQLELPHGWEIIQDDALIRGICRFGITKVGSLVNLSDDTTLANFGDFLASRDSVLGRLKVIIITNLSIQRNVLLWKGPLRHISFMISNPFVPIEPKEKQTKKKVEEEHQPEKLKIKTFPRTQILFHYDSLPRKVAFVD